MPSSTAAPWPFSAKTSDQPVSAETFWGFGPALEAQARLWNHFIDANRSLWSFYAPWLQMTPWLLNRAIAPVETEAGGEEPAQTADGIPDTLELQTRSWNRFLDANRSFWTALNWPVPGAPWVAAPNEAGTDRSTVAKAANDPHEGAAARPRSRSHAGSAKPSRARKH
ncbi:MAG TPA: hypothetical protein VJ743_11570 [Albitalea sp.]|nr:hypothetical protein [Albitalea sp.]